MNPSTKIRIDQILKQKGWAPSSKSAQAYILSGRVLVDDVPVTKPGQKVSLNSAIRLKGVSSSYVSRGALKLKPVLEEFKLSPLNQVALDVGSSTGGFTEVLLEKGVSRIYCVDCGKNQLAWKIRSHPRVKVREGVNARYLQFEDIGEKVDLVVVDVSFISLRLILQPLLPFFYDSTDCVALIKPQFEVGREKVGKGGIVRLEEDRRQAVDTVLQSAKDLGLNRVGLVKSPLKGTTGNQEYFVHWKLKS